MSKTILLLFTLLILSSNSFSQRYKSNIELGPYFSNQPFKFKSNRSVTRLNSNADRSPIPSEVRTINANRARIWSYGIYFKPRFDSRSGKQNITYIGVVDFYGLIESSETFFVSGGLGTNYNIGIADNFYSSFAGVVNIGYYSDYLGEVGNAPGDQHLEAPDGSLYYSGSNIDTYGYLIGLDLLAGLQFDTKKVGFRFDLGYRQWGELSERKYEVSDSQNTSELPGSGFDGDPFELDLSGFTYRFGLIYHL